MYHSQASAQSSCGSCVHFPLLHVLFHFLKLVYFSDLGFFPYPKYMHTYMCSTQDYLNPVCLLISMPAHRSTPTVLSQVKDQQCLEHSFHFLLGSVLAPCVPNVQVQLPTTEQATDSLRISGIVSVCVVSLGARLSCFVV